MKALTISKKKFMQLNQIILSKNITNTEAKIFDFNYKNQDKILKALYYVDGPTFANKLVYNKVKNKILGL